VIVPISDVIKGEPIVLPQNDTRLLRYIKEKEIVRPPPPKTVEYNLKDPMNKDPSVGQSQFIRKLFQEKVKNC
jgi:hypothetical protein